MNVTKGGLRVVEPRIARQRLRMRNAHWLHFVLVLFLGAAVEIVVAATWAMEQGSTFVVALVESSAAGWGVLFAWLPLAAGTSTLLVPRTSCGELLRIAGAAVTLMIAIDLFGPAATVATGERTALLQGEVFGDVVYEPFGSHSVSRTSWAFISGDLDGVTERQARYPSDHPRLRVGLALVKGSLLLLPMLLVATSAGFLAWLDREVQFRTHGTRTQVRVWVVWIASLGLFWTATSWAERGRDSAMFGSGSLTLILLPYIPLTLLAWVASRGLWHSKGEVPVTT